MTGVADGLEAVIDCAAITANVETLRAMSPTAQLMAVVKADGYGHGAAASAGAARAGGADWLGVASIDEALRLRAAGDRGSLIAWLTALESDFSSAVDADVHLSASSPAIVERIAAAAAVRGRLANVHLAVDSGLGREGAPPGEQWQALVEAAAAAQASGRVDVVGVWSHLAFADSPHHPTIDSQRQVFLEAVDVARAAGLDIRVRHLANSAATITRDDLHLDLVRPGLAVYGISPMPAQVRAEDIGLRPAMSLRAPVIGVKTLPPGHGVGYAHTYHTSAETRVALINAGYADGIPRAASGLAPAHIGGRRLTLSGRVSMDQLSVDVGAASPVALGDTAVFFGSGRDGEPTVDEFAAACGTISYEIITRLGPRVRRTYLNRSHG